MKNYLSLPRIFSFLTAAVLAGACALASPDDKNKKEAPVVPPRKGESETIQLFNGKDLDGWAFRLTCTVKLVQSEMHSGVAFWGRNAPEHGDKYTYAGHLVMFPSGWGMYDLFGRNGLPVDGEPAKKVGKQHDWNDLEILAQGNRVRVAVNGTPVVDWRDPEPDRIKHGPIGLQLHSNTVPQEVHFKNLVLETFPKEDKLTTVK